MAQLCKEVAGLKLDALQIIITDLNLTRNGLKLLFCAGL